MAGRHRVRADNIHIIHTSVLRKSENVKRANTSQFYDPNISFPLFHEKVRPSSKALASTFVASRPTTRSY